MHDVELSRRGVAPGRRIASAVASFWVDEFVRDSHRVALPCPEIQIVFRFGPSARNGLDAHALGPHHTVRRKLIRRGQRAVTARLRLGASKAVLGVPASVVAGSVLPLEDLWGVAGVQRLLDQLAGVSETIEAVNLIEASIARRLARAETRNAGVPLALEAAERLVSARVSSVAASLGVSERHLRRVFREAIGMSPKRFARLARFRHTLRAAREESRHGWAGIAAAAGYFDQAHLIAEFRAIAGVAPRALLGELGAAEDAATRR
jgi:AraC-like DNA-binding protein